jgi:hypothetical protein
VRRLVLLLGVLVLTACGGAAAPEQTASPGEILQQAAAKMSDARSARFTVEGTVRNKEFATGPLRFGAKGVSRFDGKRAWIWWDMSKIFPALGASQLPVGQREDAKRLLDDPAGWRVELRFIGRSAWVRIPAFDDLLRGKPWVRDDTPEDLLGRGQPSTWLDPGSLMVYLSALGHVEELGREDELTHYRGRVQLQRLPALTPKRDRAYVRKTIRQVIEQTGKRTFPLDVWLDDNGVPRRFRGTDFTPKGEDKYPTKWQATVEILEYGVDFDVPRPPARKVATEED